MVRTEPDTDTPVPDALADGDSVVLFDMDGVVLRDRSVDDVVYERAMADAAADYDLVGDRETDVLAARRAGLDSVFLCREHNAERRLSADPTHELASLAELDALLAPGRRGSDGPALRSRSDRPGNR
jgi:beta-phosphoglucomutase-like phosphatase (HAD superfamily)